MTMTVGNVHAYWRDVESDQFGVGRSYRALCSPEYYVNLKPVSDMWVGEFRKFVPPSASVLELGCSVGRNLYYLREAGYEVTGVEINERAKELSRLHFGAETAERIISCSIEEYMSAPRSFDVVFTSGVLMHLHPESEWVLERMAASARDWLMVAEVEDTVGLYKWGRNYQQIFEGLGWEQVRRFTATPMSERTTGRIFKRAGA